jgi:D-3-phosphoglycerate dehydrogenase
MADTVVESLILDLLEWLATADRSYDDVMDVWRTSCPKLPVWEEANDRGLVIRDDVNGRCVIRLTSSGLRLLAQRDSK